MLPSEICTSIPNSSKLRVQPKAKGEIRILSADIALIPTNKHKNDASAVFINQLVPTKAGGFVSNITYGETFEGKRTEEQALRLRSLYDEYEADYIVLDCRGVGFGVFDALSNDVVDIASGEIYPALSCCNNAELAARCTNRDAKKAIWAINGSVRFNSDCAILL